MEKVFLGDMSVTKSLACKIAKIHDKWSVIVLDGQLGAGKTTFACFLGIALGVKEIINSPTFTILKRYKYNNMTLNHFDFYRLDKDSQDYDLLDLINEDKNKSIIEWYQNFPLNLPKNTITIKIDIITSDIRKFIVIAETLEDL